MTFSQLEKILIKTAFDPTFTDNLIGYGTSAKTRYACSEKEGQVLDLLLDNGGEGLISVLNVIRSVIETRQIIQSELARSDCPSSSLATATTSLPGLFNSHIG